MLGGAQGIDNIHAGGTQRRKHAADKSHEQSKNHGLNDDAWAEREFESQFGKGLKVYGGNGDELHKRSKK